MAVITFNVPEKIKKEFQEAFAAEDRNVIIARLMEQAVEEKRRSERHAAAIEALLDLRRRQRPVSDAEIARARKAGRP